MLAACNVFGARAGQRAAERAADTGRPSLTDGVLAGPLARLTGLSESPGEVAWSEARRELKALTAATLLVVRNGPGLQAMVERVRALRHDLGQGSESTNPWPSVHVLETENLLLTAEIMARAALLREESRGSHFREDFPAQDDDRWLVNILWRSRAGEPAPTLARYRQEPAATAQIVPDPAVAVPGARV
jgi:succinate dehydrogenase/fumarate reductase flavoprotein subunit